jgi:PKD repeat protein
MALALIASAVGASSASAVLKKIGKHQWVSYQPLRGKATSSLRRYDLAFNNMDYNGGPIMPTNTDYMILWSPRGLAAFPPEFTPGLERFFKDLAHDSGGNQNTDSVTTQYNDLTGASVHYAVTFGGVIVDTDPFPPSKCPVEGSTIACLTDAQIQHEVQKVVLAHGLPTDLTHEYFLFTAPHVGNCFTDTPPSYGGCSVDVEPTNQLAAFCAYHENTTTAPMLFYSDDPYVVGNRFCDDGNHPNGPSDAELSGGLDHEHNESITDPIPNDAWTNGAGPNQGFEVGDQCDFQMGDPLGTAPNGAKYNQVINGHFYWFQEEWSNEGHRCLQRLTLKDTKPTATFTATAVGGTTMMFDATGSSAPGGAAEFSWQFNDAFAAPTQESPSPTISHTFPDNGAYSVGLAVFSPSGMSTGTGGIVVAGHSGFIPGFTFSPSSPAAGQTVTFTGLSRISRKPILNWLWEFGDGTTGSGQRPTHTYAAPGTYKVTVVQFSGVGSAFPGAGSAPVSQQTITVS